MSSSKIRYSDTFRGNSSVGTFMYVLLSPNVYVVKVKTQFCEEVFWNKPFEFYYLKNYHSVSKVSTYVVMEGRMYNEILGQLTISFLPQIKGWTTWIHPETLMEWVVSYLIHYDTLKVQIQCFCGMWMWNKRIIRWLSFGGTTLPWIRQLLPRMYLLFFFSPGEWVLGSTRRSVISQYYTVSTLTQ